MATRKLGTGRFADKGVVDAILSAGGRITPHRVFRDLDVLSYRGRIVGVGSSGRRDDFELINQRHRLSGERIHDAFHQRVAKLARGRSR